MGEKVRSTPGKSIVERYNFNQRLQINMGTEERGAQASFTTPEKSTKKRLKRAAGLKAWKDGKKREFQGFLTTAFQFGENPSKRKEPRLGFTKERGKEGRRRGRRSKTR